MLYVSTRNTTDIYTAYRALHETNAPDGGNFVPFRLPMLDQSMLRKQTGCETVAQILNLFFGLRLSAWDVECAIGKVPVKLTNLGQKVFIAEAWHNPSANYGYLYDSLCNLIFGNEVKNTGGWLQIAVEIALLLGMYSDMEYVSGGFDFAVNAGDFSDLTAVTYAKTMGLPVNRIICACDSNAAVWDFVNRGELAVSETHPKYMENFIYLRLGAEEARRYLTACESKRTYAVDETQLQSLNSDLFAAVVSENRVESVISGVYQTNQYAIDRDTAISYGALQDYRAHTGINANTVILAKKRPDRTKE